MQDYALVVSWLDQLTVAVSGLAIKPLYMILSFIIIYRLRSAASRDLKFLRYGLIGFFAGEFICGVNYLAFGSSSNLLEIFHGLGMVWMWIFLPWFVFLFIDERIIYFSSPDKKCAFLRFCKRCDKKVPDGCRMRKFVFFIIPALIITALIPFTLPLDPYSYTLKIFNSEVLFKSTDILQNIEVRAYPFVAVLLLAGSAIVLKLTKDITLWSYLFFPGFGFMTFSLFRFFFTFAFIYNPVWSNFWEEMTELLLIAGIMIFLQIFKKQFGANEYRELKIIKRK